MKKMGRDGKQKRKEPRCLINEQLVCNKTIAPSLFTFGFLF
jgi:hypothetical protein